ncbi:C-C chemokine receptor type 10 [Microcaecilia unicolor]|uniref:C-C chemokine receptor type 10 n=1 Tax=Microcaecilia unicolor TaxID=1415580 RepID=A0A6P7ZDA5_9AMPH|nr:C-C chemokine receptor type 10 [Microcaecilia unicolor]
MEELQEPYQTQSSWTEEFLQSTTDFYGDENSVDYSLMPEMCEMHDVQEFGKVYQPCIYFLVFLLGVVGNGLVLVTYVYYRKIKCMTDIYLLNLALADLLLLSTLPFMAISSIHGWIFGNEMCKIVQSVYTVNFFSGFFFLTCISIDRYIVIVQAATAHRLRLKIVYYSKITSMVVWLLSILLTIPQLIFSKVVLREEVFLCRMIFPEDVTKSIKGFSNFAQAIFGFIIPFLVMVFCYSIIIKTLLGARSFEKHKALKVIIALVVIFVVFQFPYSLVLFLEATDFLWSREMSCKESKQKAVAIIVTSSVAFTRCCLNPVLYAFIGVKFRNDVLHLMKNCGCITQAQYTKFVGKYGISHQHSYSTAGETSSLTL